MKKLVVLGAFVLVCFSSFGQEEKDHGVVTGNVGMLFQSIKKTLLAQLFRQLKLVSMLLLIIYLRKFSAGIRYESYLKIQF